MEQKEAPEVVIHVKLKTAIAIGTTIFFFAFSVAGYINLLSEGQRINSNQDVKIAQLEKNHIGVMTAITKIDLNISHIGESLDDLKNEKNE